MAAILQFLQGVTSKSWQMLTYLLRFYEIRWKLFVSWDKIFTEVSKQRVDIFLFEKQRFVCIKWACNASRDGVRSSFV